MAEKVQIENKTLVRDLHSKALLETNPKAKDEYITKRKMLNRARAAESEIETMKQELAELKAIVQILLDNHK